MEGKFRLLLGREVIEYNLLVVRRNEWMYREVVEENGQNVQFLSVPDHSAILALQGPGRGTIIC